MQEFNKLQLKSGPTALPADSQSRPAQKTGRKFTKMAAKPIDSDSHLVGVISDTHGRLPDDVLTAFKGVDLIIHAGDIDKPDVLDALGKIAPIVAVRGNMDRGPWAEALPRTEVVEIGQAILYVLHDPSALDLEPDAAGFNAVISGHTHQPALETKNGVLFLNPGSAVMPRFNTPACVALIHIHNNSLEPQFIELSQY